MESSLRRLQTDYIDLYTGHQMDESTEEQVAEVMERLIREGFGPDYAKGVVSRFIKISLL